MGNSYNGISLKELPINTHKFLNKSFIFSGGGYFRVLPYKLIRKFSRDSDYIMSYFHPRDFDIEQPIIADLSLQRKFKSYVGLKHTENKLKNWLLDFNFIDVEEADNKIDWEKVNKIYL